MWYVNYAYNRSYVVLPPASLLANTTILTFYACKFLSFFAHAPNGSQLWLTKPVCVNTVKLSSINLIYPSLCHMGLLMALIHC